MGLIEDIFETKAQRGLRIKTADALRHIKIIKVRAKKIKVRRTVDMTFLLKQI